MQLDLHQTKHADVAEKVYEHILKLSQQNQYFTGYIITGNSVDMKRLVKEELDKYNWITYIDDLYPGKIFISGY
jgi:hypothetical protein